MMCENTVGEAGMGQTISGPEAEVKEANEKSTGKEHALYLALFTWLDLFPSVF